MHTRILIAGDDQMTLAADSMLLKDRGMYVYTVMSIENIPELIDEIKPDILFFDSVKMGNDIKDAYNNTVNNTAFKNIPVIFTLSEDEMYLVKRGIRKKLSKADNVVDAVKMALEIDRPLDKYYVTRQNKHHLHSGELQLSFYV